jgi:competence protein ComEA
MKDWIKQYLSFSKKERMGLAVLLVLISAMWLLPEFFGSEKRLSASLIRKADSLMQNMNDSTGNAIKSTAIIYFRSFPFDPNTLNADGWKELGLRQKTIETIQKYIASGARFRKPSDLSKIYSLRPDEATRLIPYVVIKTDSRTWINDKVSNYSTYPDNKFYRNDVKRYRINYSVRTAKPANALNAANPTNSANYSSGQGRTYPYKNNGRFDISPVDINAADTTVFIALPGIGSRLATRIIQFREKLGGFHSIMQVAEIYGLKDSVFQLIKPFLILGTNGIKKININTAGIDSLNAHPYIQYPEARAIVQYRNQHGLFKDAGELLKISIINVEWLDRISPYLSTE